jgi:hypothetical protein
MKQIFIRNHPAHAGYWIYRGYAKAWESLGYKVQFYDNIVDIPKMANGEEYEVMCVDYYLSDQHRSVLENANRVYMFVNPNHFPHPWGTHKNYVYHGSQQNIDMANSFDNVHLWTWLDSTQYNIDSEKYKFDVCYIGGWADNGFNQKSQIMMKHFAQFKDSGLKCGLFVGKDLTHEQENIILRNSKVALNIHDDYQRQLGLDTNERTFKSLGLTGVMVSDNVTQIKNIFPSVPLASDPEEMVEIVKIFINSDELDDTKQKNRENILQNHTYVNRVKEMLEW